MKKVILFILVIMPLLVFSQKRTKKNTENPCAEIELKYDEMQGIYTAESPDVKSISLGNLKKGAYSTSILIYKKDDYKSITLFLSGFTGISMHKMTGLYIKLSNEEILRFENQELNSSYLDNNLYTTSTSLKLTDEVFKKLIDNQMVKFNFINESFDIKNKDSEQLNKYFECISNQDK